MHRVHVNQRQKLILRFVAYGVISVLTVITTIALLYVALGYRLDKSGEVVRSGMLLVDSKPESVQVRINGEEKDSSTPSRFVLPVGAYDLNLQRDGYRPWNKTVDLGVSAVREVYYPRLLPLELTPRSLTKVTAPDVISQSPDRKLIFTYVPQEENPSLITLNGSKAPEIQLLALPSGIVRENGLLGSLQTIEWSDDNRHVLILQSLSAGKKRLLSIDVGRPERSVDITALFKNKIPSDPHFVPGTTDEFFAVQAEQLNRYELSGSKTTPLLSQVKSYTVYNKNTISFARLSDNKKAIEYGVLSDDGVVVVARGNAKVKNPLTSYDEFDDHTYLTVGSASDARATIYRDPLKKPILTKQLPYAYIKLPAIESFELSDNNQFLLARSGQKVVVYNFDEALQYAYTLPKKTSTVDWLDDWHLQIKTEENKTYLAEYDGQNLNELVDVSLGDVMFSNDIEFLYRFNTEKKVTNLQVVDLVVQ